MKKRVIVFVSIIGLVGFTVNSFAQEEKTNTGMTLNPNVIDLPEAARNALDAAGITDIASMIVTDKNGQIHMLKYKETEHRETTFPIPTTEIQGMTSIGLVGYKGSNCCTHIIGGVPVTICW